MHSVEIPRIFLQQGFSENFMKSFLQDLFQYLVNWFHEKNYAYIIFSFVRIFIT